MSRELHRRIEQLERKNRQLRGRIGLLERQVETLEHDKEALRLELQEERAQHAITRQHLAELIHATEHADERFQAMLLAYGARHFSVLHRRCHLQ